MSYPCDCGKNHRSAWNRLQCQEKRAAPTCTCPTYWRRRWTSHSVSHGCPQAVKGSRRPQEPPGRDESVSASTDTPETGEDE